MKIDLSKQVLFSKNTLHKERYDIAKHQIYPIKEVNHKKFYIEDDRGEKQEIHQSIEKFFIAVDWWV